MIDNDVSAYSGRRRPGYEKLMELVRAGSIDKVVVWHTDRLLRSMKDLEAYITASEQHGVGTHGVMVGDINLATADGRMNARIAAAIAQREVEHRADRMRAKQKQSTEAGLWIGGTRPFGWRIEDGRPVVDEAEASLVREAFDRVLAGGSLGGIIRDWNDAGVTTSTGRVWSYATLRQMLTRSRNAGVVRYGDQEGAWPAIVDEVTWRSVCALLADPERRRSTSNRARWLLAGIARCECGSRVRTGSASTGSGTAVIYRCREAGPGHVGRRAVEVDRLVEGAVLGYLERADVLAKLRAGEPRAASGADLDAEAQRLRTRLDEAAAMFAAGDITAAQLRRVTGDLRPQLTAVEARMEASRGDGALAPFLRGEEGVRDVWERLGTEARRAIVAELLEVTLLRTDRRAGRFFDPTTVRLDWRAGE